MKSVGLTGGIAAGKSTVAQLLRDRSVPVLDADEVARDVVAPGSDGLAAVVERFGQHVVLPDGSLDRKALGAIVMGDSRARAELERITHPRIFRRMEQWLEARAAEAHPAAVIEAALMVETGSWKRYDALLVVRCSPEVQLRRLMARQGHDEATARRWLASQLPMTAKAALATAIIDNDGPEDGLSERLDRAWARCMS